MVLNTFFFQNYHHFPSSTCSFSYSPCFPDWFLKTPRFKSPTAENARLSQIDCVCNTFYYIECEGIYTIAYIFILHFLKSLTETLF